MKIPRIIIIFFILISGFMASCSPEDAHTTIANQEISGDVINGYRIIPIPNTGKNIQLNLDRTFPFIYKFPAPPTCANA